MNQQQKINDLDDLRKKMNNIFKKETGEFISYLNLKRDIPVDCYVDIAPGISAKQYNGFDDCVLSTKEAKYIEYLSEMGFTAETHLILLVEALKGAKFGKHFHRRGEHIFVGEGKMYDSSQDVTFYKNEFFFTAPMTSHAAKFPVKAFIISMIKHE
jgi:hypothetical protein